MKSFIVCLALVSAKKHVKPDYSKFKHLAFHDDFAKLDLNKWRPEITAGGGGNWEFQFYNNDRRAAFVEDKTLYIKPTLTMDYLNKTAEDFVATGTLSLWGNAPGMQCTANGFYGCERGSNVNEGIIVNPVMSAQLRTVNSYNFKYGRVEVVARLPLGDWLWPAIWMLPKNHAYGIWPGSGEIDIVESRGNSDNCFGPGVSTVSSTLHWGKPLEGTKADLTTDKVTTKGSDFSQKFTKFTMEWTEKHIRTWADSEPIMNVEFDKSFFKRGNFSKTEFNPWANSETTHNSAPFDEEFYLILNVAVGGINGYFPANSTCPGAKKPWDNASKSAAAEFFKNRKDWIGTWNCGAQKHPSALAIKSVKVFTDQPTTC